MCECYQRAAVVDGENAGRACWRLFFEGVLVLNIKN